MAGALTSAVPLPHAPAMDFGVPSIALASRPSALPPRIRPGHGRWVVLAIALSALVLGGCADPTIQRKDGSFTKRGFEISRVVKGDMDDVAEAHQASVLRSLRTLALKFYKRNPREFRKSGFDAPEPAVEALFASVDDWEASALRKLEWTRRLAEAWQPDTRGDRVRALMEGMLVMCMASYDHHRKFYLTTTIDAQKLYNSARNLEAVAWKVGQARDLRGNLILLSNSMDADASPNLSFEREFGKLIATQDNLALIVEDKDNRTLRSGMVNLATMVFLPIP